MAEIETDRRWQTDIRCLNDGIAHIYKTKEFADVTLSVGLRTFKAHLLILHAKNPFLANEISVQTNGDVGKSNVILDNISEDGFENLLHYIYTDELKYTDENFLETYRGAVKYKHKGMISKCQAIIEKWEITLENVCDLLENAMDIKTLKDCCTSFINNNAISVLKSEGFKSLSCMNVKELLDEGKFQHVPTVTLLNSILIWAENQFEPQEDYQMVRNLLMQSEKPILGQLGIETLTYLELTDLVSKCKNLLTEKEALQFFMHAGNPSAQVPDWCSSK